MLTRTYRSVALAGAALTLPNTLAAQAAPTRPQPPTAAMDDDGTEVALGWVSQTQQQQVVACLNGLGVPKGEERQFAFIAGYFTPSAKPLTGYSDARGLLFTRSGSTFSIGWSYVENSGIIYEPQRKSYATLPKGTSARLKICLTKPTPA